METIKKQKLLKEGLNIIDSWEKYTSKNRPETYKKYLALKEKRIINFSSKWGNYMLFIKYHINRKINERKFVYNNDDDDDIFTENKTFKKTFERKVFLQRENIIKVNDIVVIIDNISKLPNQSKRNYIFKCIDFLVFKE